MEASFGAEALDLGEKAAAISAPFSANLVSEMNASLENCKIDCLGFNLILLVQIHESRASEDNMRPDQNRTLGLSLTTP